MLQPQSELHMHYTCLWCLFALDLEENVQITYTEHDRYFLFVVPLMLHRYLRERLNVKERKEGEKNDNGTDNYKEREIYLYEENKISSPLRLNGNYTII
jgi:hypothetical protein